MEYLAQHIESLIFSSEHPISMEEIQAVLEEAFETELQLEDLEQALNQVKERYMADEYAFEVVPISGGYQFMTKGAYHHTIGTLLRQNTKTRLSRAALETLAIIAYRQPVSKGEMEKIRGVSCDYSVQKLLEKELVEIIGRSDGPGRPLLYGTSAKFMDYFGMADLSELPKLKDFEMPDEVLGEAAPIEENVRNEAFQDRPSDETEAKGESVADAEAGIRSDALLPERNDEEGNPFTERDSTNEEE